MFKGASETPWCHYCGYKRERTAKSKSWFKVLVLQFQQCTSDSSLSAEYQPKKCDQEHLSLPFQPKKLPTSTYADLPLQQSQNVNKKISIRFFFPPGFLHYLIGDRCRLCNKETAYKPGHTAGAYKPAHAILHLGICKLASLFRRREGC